MNTIKKIKRVISLFMVGIIVTLSMSLSFTSLNVRASDAATTDDAGNASDYSFDTYASVSSAALADALADENASVLSTAYGKVSPANAGGLLGYTNKNNTHFTFGLFMQQLTVGSNTKEYKSLTGNMYKDIGGGTGQKVFSNYVATGAALADLGLDDTGNAAETIGIMSERGLSGSITLAAYVLSQSVMIVFSTVIKMLQLFNPFGLFKTVTKGGAWNSSIINATKNAAGDDTTPLFETTGGIVQFIGKLYDLLFDFGWVLLVIMFGVMIIRFIMPGNHQRLTGLKNWITRALFIFGGIAILGSTYTELLGWLQDQASGSNTTAAKVIASTFCDFESYAIRGFPPIGKSIPVSVSSGGITSNGNGQDICFAINKEAIKVAGGKLPDGLNDLTGGGDDSIKKTVDGISKDLTTERTNVDADTIKWVFNTILRYQTGKKIYSSSYESLWKAKNWNDSSKNPAALRQIGASLMADPKSFNMNQASFTGTFDGSEWASGDGTISPFATGSGSASSISGTENNGAATSSTFDLNITDSTIHGNTLKLGGWSAMSVFNYLNTTFDSNALTVYSAANSASNYTRDSHYSVNLVGRGVGAAINLLTCVTLLITFGILGFAYGFGILMTNIKRGVRLIVAVPGAMLGSLQAIARVISYTVLMIVEIIINMVLYMLSTELLYIFATSIVSSFTSALSRSGLFATTVEEIVSPILGFVVIVALIWFTVQAVKLRKPITKAVEEMADNVVQKFIVGGAAASANVNTNGKMGSAGAGAGAGAAVAEAGEHKGAKGFENFIPIYGTAKNASAKHHAQKAKTEAEGNKMLADMGIVGGSGSALADEANAEAYSTAKRKAKRDAMKAKMTGGLKTAVGAAEVAAGYMTGNAALAAKGAKTAANGVGDIKSADINKTNDLAAAANAASVASGGQDSVAAELAQTNNNNIEGLDLKKEAAGAAGAALGGAAGVDGGDTENIATEITKTETVKTTKSSTESIDGSKTTAKLTDGSDKSESKDLTKSSIITENEEQRSVAGVVKSSESSGGKNLGDASRAGSVKTVQRENSTEIVDKYGQVISTGGGNPGVIGKTSSSGGKTLTGSRTQIHMKSEDVVTEEHTTTTTTKFVNKGGGGKSAPAPQTPSGRMISSVVNSQNNVNHNLQTNNSYASTGGSSGHMGERAATRGKTFSQKATDIVTVQHDTQYNHVGGNGGTGNYNGPAQVRGGFYNQNVQDNVNVNHDTQYNHAGGYGGTGNYAGPQQEVGQSYSQNVVDNVNVDHVEMISEISQPKGGQLHVNNKPTEEV